MLLIYATRYKQFAGAPRPKHIQHGIRIRSKLQSEKYLLRSFRRKRVHHTPHAVLLRHCAISSNYPISIPATIVLLCICVLKLFLLIPHSFTFDKNFCSSKAISGECYSVAICSCVFDVDFLHCQSRFSIGIQLLLCFGIRYIFSQEPKKSHHCMIEIAEAINW